MGNAPNSFSRLHHLEQLFGSATRLHLLRLFLHNEAKPYFMRELARTIGVQLHAVRREIANLTNLGIVMERAPTLPGDSKRRYYELNKEHVLVPELRALMLKTDVLLEHDLAEALGKIGNVQYLALTGRFVGATEVGTDMLVVGKLNREAVRGVVQRFEKRYGHEIRYTVMGVTEFQSRKALTDKFLYGLFESNKMVLKNELGIS